VIFAPLEMSQCVEYLLKVTTNARKVLTQKNVVQCLKMDLEGFKPQFSKLGPTIKMTLQDYSSNFFHFESIEIDEK
jgi:hypothetical protein